MGPPGSDRTAMLIVRLWIEPGHEPGVRARLTQTSATEPAEQAVAVVASIAEICAVVKQWAEGFLESSAP